MDEAEANDFDAVLDAVLIGGREVREIRIVECSESWPRRFEGALGATAQRVEHIGSTAVPSLAAKPIVDILVAVTDPDDESTYLPRMEAAGYVLRVREPGHRMLRTPERDVHVHIWPAGGEDERRDLVFRDRLRESAEDRPSTRRSNAISPGLGATPTTTREPRPPWSTPSWTGPTETARRGRPTG